MLRTLCNTSWDVGLGKIVGTMGRAGISGSERIVYGRKEGERRFRKSCEGATAHLLRLENKDGGSLVFERFAESDNEMVAFTVS